MSVGMLTRSASRLAWWVWPLAALAALLGAGAARAQVSVVLKPTAVVALASGDTPPTARDLTLADVADIDPPSSPEGAKIGEIVVGRFDSAAGFVTISIAQVREAMDAARVAWARTTLRGSNCRVTAGDGAVAPQGVSKLTPKAPPTSAVPQPIDAADQTTIRGAIAGRLAALYSVSMDDLRLAFDTPDEAFLAQQIGERRVDVQPASGGASARTPVNVFIYDGDRLAESRLVATRALLNRVVVTARAPITRSQAISSDMVEVGRQWLPPNTRVSASVDQVVGQIASRPIAAGAIVASADVTAPVVCKRGDIVWVHVLSGGMSVKAKARAMAQARDGERVQLKLDGSDRTFTARMSGVGKAVMVADDVPDTQSTPSIPEGTDAPGMGDSDTPPLRIVRGPPAARPVRKTK